MLGIRDKKRSFEGGRLQKNVKNRCHKQLRYDVRYISIYHGPQDKTYKIEVAAEATKNLNRLLREPSSLSSYCLIVETMIRLVVAYSDRRIKPPRALFDTISLHDIAESFRRGENTGSDRADNLENERRRRRWLAVGPRYRNRDYRRRAASRYFTGDLAIGRFHAADSLITTCR